MVVCNCRTSYSGNGNRWIAIWANVDINMTKITKPKQALSSNPSTIRIATELREGPQRVKSLFRSLCFWFSLWNWRNISFLNSMRQTMKILQWDVTKPLDEASVGSGLKFSGIWTDPWQYGTSEGGTWVIWLLFQDVSEFLWWNSWTLQRWILVPYKEQERINESFLSLNRFMYSQMEKYVIHCL